MRSDHLAKHQKIHQKASTARNKEQSKMIDTQISKSVNSTTLPFDVAVEVTSTTRTPEPSSLLLSSSSSPLSSSNSVVGEHGELSDFLERDPSDRFSGKGMTGRLALLDPNNNNHLSNKNPGIMSLGNGNSCRVDIGENIQYSMLSPSPTLSPSSSCSDSMTSSPSSKCPIVSPSSSSMELTSVKSLSPEAQVQTSFSSNQFPLHHFQPHFPSSYYDNNSLVNQSICNPSNSISNSGNNAHFTSSYPLHNSFSSNKSAVNNAYHSSNASFQSNFPSHHYPFQQHLHSSLFGM